MNGNLDPSDKSNDSLPNDSLNNESNHFRNENNEQEFRHDVSAHESNKINNANLPNNNNHSFVSDKKYKCFKLLVDPSLKKNADRRIYRFDGVVSQVIQFFFFQ